MALILAEQTIGWLPALRDRMAVHFGGDGAADGPSSKRVFATTARIELAVTIRLFVCAGLLKRLPARLIGVPNKTRWPRQASDGIAIGLDRKVQEKIDAGGHAENAANQENGQTAPSD